MTSQILPFKRLNGTELKIIALIAMTFDHIGLFIMGNYLPFRIIGRIAFPIFAFMIGSLFGSSTLAVSLSLFILLMGQTATMFLSQYEFAKYIWLSNDLAQFVGEGTPIISDITFSFAVIVNIVYAIIFLAVTFIYFMRRDITA